MSYDGQFPDADIDKSPWQQTVPVTNTGRKRITVPKCATIFLHIQTTSSLAFKVDGYFRYEQDLPVPIKATLQSGAVTAAGTTITPTANDVWVLQGAGLHAFDLNVSAGTGAVQVRCSEVPWDSSGAGVSVSFSPSASTLTTTTPSVATATSVTLVAANASRKYLLVQNDTAANIMISLSGAALTDIVPSATNIGIVIPAGGSYESTGTACPVSAITVYQTSGGTVRTIVAVEG